MFVEWGGTCYYSAEYAAGYYHCSNYNNYKGNNYHYKGSDNSGFGRRRRVRCVSW